jgi:SH3 domain protein
MRSYGYLAMPCLCGILILASASHARTMYVTDSIDVVMRSAREVSSQTVMQVLSSGTPVEVSETNGAWATVRVDGRTGYVFKRYLISRQPYKVVAERLQQEVEQHRTNLTALTEQLTTLRNEYQHLQQLHTEQQARLAEVSTQYEALREGAEHYTQLRADYAALQRAQSQSQQRFAELNNTYQFLKKSRNLLWFLCGAGIVVMGWLCGILTERWRGRRRRQRGSFYQLPV